MRVTYLTKDNHQQTELDYNEISGPLNLILHHLNRDIENKAFIVITNINELL